MKNVITLCACFLLIFATISCSFVFMSNNSSDMYVPRKLEDFIIMFSEQGTLFKFDKTKLFYEDQVRLIKENKELIDKFQNDAFSNPDLETLEKILAFIEWFAVLIWQVLQIIFTLFALIFGVIYDLFEFVLCVFNILNFLFYPVKV